MSNESTEQQGVEAIPMGILAANMKAERKRNKVSRAELAERMGVSPGLIRKFSTFGVRSVDLFTLSVH